MPTPFALNRMSGNFDLPPASSHQLGPPTTRTRSHYTQNRHAEPQREGYSLRQIPSTSLENQRRLLEAHLQETEAELSHRHNVYHPPGVPAARMPASALRPRSHRTPAHANPSWGRTLGRENRTLRAGPQIMQEAVNRLNRATSSISAALNPPLPPLRSSDATTHEYPAEAAVNETMRQRAKRRKLNDGLLAKEFGPNYGYRGQVVPGPLRMEIVFCNGGLHDYSKDRYGPENILRNDLSVYCTRSSKCDMVLRHEGGAPFCLQKLVIKAPETGFTAPIQEGLVFVAMDLEGLILKASRYIIRESASPSAPSSPSSSPQSPVLLTDHDPAFDFTPQRGPGQRSRRRAEDGTQRFVPPPISTSAHRASNHSDNGEIWHSPSHQFRNPAPDDVPNSDIQPVQSDFNVTIDCDSHSDDEQEESSEAILADRMYRDRIPSPHDSSDEGDEPNYANFVYGNGPRRRHPPGNWRERRRTVPRTIGIDEPSGAGDGDQAKDSPDVVTPHAIIFIEKEKSMVSVKFEPAV
ncbi:MAG: hypothetical protein Q9170_000245 [Blastenia crenularia]